MQEFIHRLVIEERGEGKSSIKKANVAATAAQQQALHPVRFDLVPNDGGVGSAEEGLGRRLHFSARRHARVRVAGLGRHDELALRLLRRSHVLSCDTRDVLERRHNNGEDNGTRHMHYLGRHHAWSCASEDDGFRASPFMHAMSSDAPSPHAPRRALHPSALTRPEVGARECQGLDDMAGGGLLAA